MSASPPPVLTEASPFEAAREAFEYTRRVLFPFRLDVWLALGLVAFLDQCGRGGFSVGIPSAPPVGGPGDGGSSGPGDWGGLDAWLTAHLALVIGVVVGVLVAVLALTALFLWISSRATFVYIDDVARGRAEIARPWRAHAERATSYFRWRLALAAALFAGLGALVVMAVVALVALSRGHAAGGTLAVLAFVVLVPLFFIMMIGAALMSLAMRDFVAPLQIHGNMACGDAVALLWQLVLAQPIPFLLYVVLKVAFAVGQGVVILLAACLTCCLALIPIVTQTVLQPLFFFERAWSLFLLRRMGYDVFARRE